MNKPEIISIIFLAFSLLIAGCDSQKKVDYKIGLTAKTVSNHQVEFNVTTNIPLPIEVMASVNLKGQNPDDTYVGYSKKIFLKESNQIFVLNTASKNLPRGNYIAEVTFYPRWGAKKGSPKASKLKKTISGSFEISLQGTSESAEEVQEINEMQRWVMENVIIGTPWDRKTFIGKLGNCQEFRVQNRNPNIIKSYYFPKPNITIIVNIYKNSVVTWRKGKTSNL